MTAAHNDSMLGTKTVSTTKPESKSTYCPFNKIELPLSKKKSIFIV